MLKAHLPSIKMAWIDYFAGEARFPFRIYESKCRSKCLRSYATLYGASGTSYEARGLEEQLHSGVGH